MKKVYILCILLVGLSAGCGEGSGTASRSEVTPDEYFSALDSYGTWMDVAGLGRVWQPAEPYDWRPFGDGQWVWTDRGWMWMSDEPFAWVVYHYGYWSHWGAAGWLWVPAYDWSPARVHWYSGNDYIGWAPLPPPGINPPRAYDEENIWVVVPSNQFTREHVVRYRVPTQRSMLAPLKEERRAPDIGFVRRATNTDVRRWTTESEEVRRGDRPLVRMRVREEAPPGTVAPPPSVVTPPPAARPAPEPPQEKVRQSGQTRTPGSTRATPSQPKRPATPEAKPAQPKTPGAPGATPTQPRTPATPKAVPRSPQRTGARERPQVPDTAQTRAPRR